ncbi:hypothetical protein KIPB_009544, partial [Kipferlia bialata]
VIYVDADAVWRHDIGALYDTPQLHPLAGVPHGTSRDDMAEWRYFEGGWWQDQLEHRANKDFWILCMFTFIPSMLRTSDVMPLIRANYMELCTHGLSLEGVDQDLVNIVNGDVEGQSLDPRWATCFTWATEEEVQRAWMVDTCADPLVPGTKVELMERHVPEWDTLRETVRGMYR